MKSLIFFTLFMASAWVASAQLNFGFKAGANLNDIQFLHLSDNEMDAIKPNVAYHAGLFTQVTISKVFFIIPELQFIQRGAHSSVYGEKQSRINLNYLELPVLTAYSPVKLIQLEMGPSFSVKLSARGVREGNSSSLHFGPDFEAGLTSGVKLNLTDKFSIISRYYRGLTYTEKVSFDVLGGGKVVTEEYKAYNYNIQLAIAYKLFSKSV